LLGLTARGALVAECGSRLIGGKVMLAEYVQRTASVARAGKKTNHDGFNIGVTTEHNASSLY
jgi:hypothetical protein